MTTPTDKAKWDDARRDTWIFATGLLSAALALGCLYYAICYGKNASEFGKRLVVGFWTLAPPVYFWLDWYFLCSDIPKDKVESVKHVHDLSRNIWLAFIVVLIGLFEMQVFKP